MLTRNKLIGFSILAVIAFLSALTIGYFVLFGGSTGPTPTTTPPGNNSITLEVWGLFDDSDVYDPIFQAYTKAHPQVNLRYKKFVWDDYETTLVNALASGRGPDIFMIHNTWLAKHQDKLAPAPEKTPLDFVLTAFNEHRPFYGIPLFIDNLALFYNQDLLAREGFTNPPKDWKQFVDYTKALTRFSPNGTLIQSGAAMGTNSVRVNRATDILLLLMLQNGIEPFNAKTKEVTWANDTQYFSAAKDALKFYTDFANPAKDFYSWNADQDYSIDGFWEGKVAMMFNYAYNIPTIKDKAPYLNFATAPLPTKNGRTISVGNYWGLVVSKQSAHTDTAWDFLRFFATDEQYTAYIHQTGRLPAKPKLLEAQKTDPLLRAFAEQAGSARTPYQPDERKVQEILDQMIEKVNKGELTLDQALRFGSDQLKLLIK